MQTQIHIENAFCRERQRLEWHSCKPRSTRIDSHSWKVERQGSIPSRVSEKAWLCWHFDFRFLAFRLLASCLLDRTEKINVCCLKPPSLLIFVIAAPGNWHRVLGAVCWVLCWVCECVELGWTEQRAMWMWPVLTHSHSKFNWAVPLCARHCTRGQDVVLNEIDQNSSFKGFTF